MENSIKKLIITFILLACMSGCYSQSEIESDTFPVDSAPLSAQNRHFAWRLRELDKKLTRVEYKLDMVLPRKYSTNDQR